jgi:hypothetical protein
MQEQHKQAIRLLDKIRQYCDMPNAPAAVELKNQAQKLIDMFEQQKNARTLEEQVVRVQNAALRMRDDEMDYNDRDDVKDRCDDMRMALRKLK